MAVVCPLCNKTFDKLSSKKQHVFPKTLVLNLTKAQPPGKTSMANVVLTKTSVNDFNQSDVKMKGLTCDECENDFTLSDQYLREFFIDKSHTTFKKLNFMNRKPFLKMSKGFKYVAGDLLLGEVIKPASLNNLKRALLSVVLRYFLYRKRKEKIEMLTENEFALLQDIWMNSKYDELILSIAKYTIDKGVLVYPFVSSSNPLILLMGIDSYTIFIFCGNKSEYIEEKNIPVLKKHKQSIVTEKQIEMAKIVLKK